MAERVAVVGSREGANLSDVVAFLCDLWRKYPDTIIVSGGADGVDRYAESTWQKFGGRVESFRPVLLKRLPNADESWGIEKWELGGSQPRKYLLIEEPTWANFKSAAIYRDILIAEAADRTVSFMRAGGSRGAGFTAETAEKTYGRPTYRFEARRAA